MQEDRYDVKKINKFSAMNQDIAMQQALKPAETHPSYADEWWRGAIIYQIYPRSFRDTSGDGIGDLKGITEKLDYIASLGVDAIWISPFFKSPMKDYGYDVSDYCEIDPLFGTMEDFDALVAKANSLNLRIMIDQVYSHTSDEHPWFKESRSSRDNPKADWFVWADPKPDGSPPNNWLSIFGGSAWAWDTRRRQYYLHNFLECQPDLNFHHPEMRAALWEIARFWLKKGVRGFRLDTVNFYTHDHQLRDNPPHEGEPLDYVPASNPYSMQKHLYDKTRPENLAYLEELRKVLDEYPDTTAVGEMGAQNSLALLQEYTEYKRRMHMVYTFHFMNEKFSAEHFRNTVRKLEDLVGNGWPCWAFSNHDVVRAVTRWHPAKEKHDDFAKLLIALLASLRGSLCIYEGEELALPEAEIPYEKLQDPYGLRFWPEFKGRDGCRTPMPWQKSAPHAGFSTNEPWLPIPDAHVDRAVDVQENDPASVLAHYRRFIHWRKQFAPLRCGSIALIDTPEPILAFLRGWKEARVLCLFNLSDQPQRCRSGAWQGAVPADGHGFTAEINGDEIALPPYGAFFATLKG